MTTPRDYEVRLWRNPIEDYWTLDIYNPNIGVVVDTLRKNFSSSGEAECWLDIWASEVRNNGYELRAEIAYDTDLTELTK